MSVLEPGKLGPVQFVSVCFFFAFVPGPDFRFPESWLRPDSQELLPVEGLDSHPEEEDGDESDDEDHEEGDGDADEGGRVDAERVGQAVGVDHHLILGLARQRKLNVVWRQNLPIEARIKLGSFGSGSVRVFERGPIVISKYTKTTVI